MKQKTKDRPPKYKLTKERLGNQIKSIVGNPFNLITLLSFLLLIVLVVIPLLTLVEDSFIIEQSDVRRAKVPAGSFSVYYWQYLLASKMSLTMF